MLVLAPPAPGVVPLDAGERFALDLLLDLSCVLRARETVGGEVVRLRVDEGSGAPIALRGLAAGHGVSVRDGEVRIERALLARVRDIAGGVAEQRSEARDRFQRVPSSENALVRAEHDLEREPVVSQCARAITSAVTRAAGRRPVRFIAPWPNGRRWAAALTHDLDVVDWWPAFTALRLAELLRKGEVSQLIAVLGAVTASAGRNVVWRGVREVLETEAAHDVRSTWFVLCGTPSFATARVGDLTYLPEGPLARQILHALKASGHEIGLHGSFSSLDDPSAFAIQRRRLALLTGSATEGVRQHYLRIRSSSTPADMRLAGFEYDSTLGFADRNGFRLGVADVVPLWDAAQSSTLPIDEAPFCWMDRALSKYRGIERPHVWIDDALELADRCRAVQGMFAGIWHPNLTAALGFPGAAAAYARLVAGLVSRNAYIAPLGELVTWRRTRREVRAHAVAADGTVVLANGMESIILEDAQGARVHAGR